MKGFWNKFGDRFLSRIEQGTLKVVYSDGTQRTYGNGEAPSTSMVIHDSRFFRRLALYGDIGFAESYMDGDFESTDLTNLISIALLNSKALAAKSEDKAATVLSTCCPSSTR